MADITPGLPTLSPKDIQAQQDRARLAALGGTLGAGAQRLGAAFNDIFTMPVRAVMGAANTALRVPNAFGAGIPYIPDNGLLSSTTPYSDTLNAQGVPLPGTMPALPAMMAPAPQATAAIALPPPPAAAPAPVPVGAAAGTPKSGGTKTAASMPASAPAPLVPGETGFYMNDQLVPYGTRFDVSGGGVRQIGGPGADLSSLPGGGKMRNGQFVDYRDAVEYGLQAQQRMFDYGREALGGINGAELGAGSRMRALASMMGTNNFGGNAVGGANALNQAIASITSAETNAGATMGSARLRSGDVDRQIDAQRDLHGTDSVITGSTIGTDANNMSVVLPTYGQRPLKPGAMPMPYNPQAPNPKPKEGATGTDSKGHFTVKSGEKVYDKK